MSQSRGFPILTSQTDGILLSDAPTKLASPAAPVAPIFRLDQNHNGLAPGRHLVPIFRFQLIAVNENPSFRSDDDQSCDTIYLARNILRVRTPRQVQNKLLLFITRHMKPLTPVRVLHYPSQFGPFIYGMQW